MYLFQIIKNIARNKGNNINIIDKLLHSLHKNLSLIN